MIHPVPVELSGHGVRLEPLQPDHAEDLARAVADGRLWELPYTFAPQADRLAEYIVEALEGQGAGHMLAWAVRDVRTGTLVGSTRYHDIVCDLDRVEIGYTWYAARWHRTHVNTACKLLLLSHAFDALGCAVVGLRTDNLNTRSQRAIEALGAQKDGVLRHHGRRRDGTVRDSHMYSILYREWPDVRARLTARLARHGTSAEPGDDAAGRRHGGAT